jgi:predicted nucleotidyltransferase
MELNTPVPTVDIRQRIPDEVIGELASQIAARFKPRRIILFGSYACGNPGPLSDIDLLIVMETPLREIRQAIEIRQYLNPLFGVDILVYTPSRLKQRLEIGDPFIKEVLTQGKILYECGDA